MASQGRRAQTFRSRKAGGEPFPLRAGERWPANTVSAGKFNHSRRLLIEGDRRRREPINSGSGARFLSWFLRARMDYRWELGTAGFPTTFLAIVDTAVAWIGMELGWFVRTKDQSRAIPSNALSWTLYKTCVVKRNQRLG